MNGKQAKEGKTMQRGLLYVMAGLALGVCLAGCSSVGLSLIHI